LWLCAREAEPATLANQLNSQPNITPTRVRLLPNRKLVIQQSTVFEGDALAVLQRLSSNSVQSIVTSPPYWGLRDYGIEGQIGLEESVDQYLSRLVEVLREARRVLASDGTMWLSIGDSYTSGNRT